MIAAALGVASAAAWALPWVGRIGWVGRAVAGTPWLARLFGATGAAKTASKFLGLSAAGTWVATSPETAIATLVGLPVGAAVAMGLAGAALVALLGYGAYKLFAGRERESAEEREETLRDPAVAQVTAAAQLPGMVPGYTQPMLAYPAYAPPAVLPGTMNAPPLVTASYPAAVGTMPGVVMQAPPVAPVAVPPAAWTARIAAAPLANIDNAR